MATVSTPVSAWVASVFPGASTSAGASNTATVNITAGWEIQMPVRCVFSRVSADPQVYVYRSMDGGASFDSVPFASFAITRVATGTGQASVALSTGQYVVRMDAYTSQEAVTFQILTQLVITAVSNV